jgi:hypothetical protein
MNPISLLLIDKGVKPVHARPYTVPRAVEQQLRTEIARLEDIGVLEEDYTSKWHPQPLLFLRRMELLELFLISENSIPYLNVTHFLYQRLGI